MHRCCFEDESAARVALEHDLRRRLTASSIQGSRRVTCCLRNACFEPEPRGRTHCMRRKPHGQTCDGIEACCRSPSVLRNGFDFAATRWTAATKKIVYERSESPGGARYLREGCSVIDHMRKTSRFLGFLGRVSHRRLQWPPSIGRAEMRACSNRKRFDCMDAALLIASVENGPLAGSRS